MQCPEATRTAFAGGQAARLPALDFQFKTIVLLGTNLFQFTKICKEFEMTIAFSETKFSYRPSCVYVHIPNWHL
jgi:hypothetical protein